MSPESPKLGRSRGVVNFSETGFSIVGGQARMLGGDMRLEGGTVVATTVPLPGGLRVAPDIVLRASGTASADGLRQARELGFVARLAQRASGSAAYSAVVGFRRGELELLVNSNLQGLGLSLPQPLVKSPDALLPFRLETALLRESMVSALGVPTRLKDQLTVDVGRLASIVYVRDVSGPEPRVIRGSMAVGLVAPESAPMPAEGVVANLNLANFDLDAWDSVLSQATGSSLTDVASTRNAAGLAGSAALSYLPTSMAVRARSLTVGGRTLHNLVVGSSREGLQWRANLDASELNGYLEYRQPSGVGPGRVFARLARLTIAPEAATDVESLLNEQPANIPALDIVVDDFELKGKHLGRVEIEATNRGAGPESADRSAREWRLNKFNIITPEATLTANGNWASVNAQNATVGSPSSRRLSPRRTVMNFKLDIADSGELLSRFGMKGVVRKGRGKMVGQVAWIGSPLTLDYPSLAGSFTVNIESGQFLKADPGIAKLLGV